MSILLVDIGNTRIKWAGFDGRRLGKQQAAEFAGWEPADFASRLLKSLRGVERIVVSSVAGSHVNRAFMDVAKHAGAPAPEFVASQRRAAGVTIAYLEPWRLGVDRFAMAIAGHWIADGRPACIISVGTALTIDLVDSVGQHRGGAILPAPQLMIDSLLTKTNGIRKRAAGGAGVATAARSATQSGRATGLFARTTRTAIQQGALFAAAAVIDRGVAEARRLVGRAPKVLLTGGGAKAVAPLVRSAYLSVPDLVLQGLAILAVEGRQPATAS